MDFVQMMLNFLAEEVNYNENEIIQNLNITVVREGFRNISSVN